MKPQSKELLPKRSETNGFRQLPSWVLRWARRRMGKQPARRAQDSRRLVPSIARDAAKPRKAEGLRLMDAVVERSNLWRAYERIMLNKYTAGVYELTVFELKAWLQQHWPSVKVALLAGNYMAAIRKVEMGTHAGYPLRCWIV